MGEDNYQFYLNDSLITAAGRKKQDIIDESVEWLKQDPQFLYVFDEEKISETTMPDAIKESMQNGYFRGRSGEIGVVTRPQFLEVRTDQTSVGPNMDSHSHTTRTSFPPLWMEREHGATNVDTHIVDIAPTVCAMLHIQMPNGCVGKARNQF